MHTKIWSENMQKVDDNIKIKFKTGAMANTCVCRKKTFPVM